MAGDTDIRLAHGAPAPIAAAPIAGGAEIAQRLPANADAPRLARQMVADTLASWERRDLVDASLLIVSELVANAVRYGGADLTVALTRRADAVRIAVGDASDAAPIVREADRTALGGRGLPLIDALAREWGHAQHGRGKVVWADVA